MNLTQPANIAIRVLVADNDVATSAAETVARFEDGPFKLTYLHAPSQNISIARNTCLDAATGDWVAWVDDDETVATDWLAELYMCATSNGYDAVFGPAIARYPPNAPSYLTRGDFHSNHPVSRGGVIQTGHTCNALVDLRRPETRALRFDTNLGKTGGEDTDYFFRLWKSGGLMGVCDSAPVFEKVSHKRLSQAWVLRRSYNAGHSHARQIQVQSSGLAKLLPASSATLKAVYCLFVAGIVVASKSHRLQWFRRSVMHFGVLAGLANIGAKVRYGSST